ncbi:MAG: hypothetical protein IJS17_06580 [Clostridia bacterium]|nr:hypothetical protein [Clostridia bacterium]
MSIKGSSGKIKTEAALPIFLVFAVIAAALRLYQYFTIIETDTGFFSEENFTVPLLYGILAVAGVLIFVITYLAKKVPLSTLPEGKSIPLAIAGSIFSLSFLIDAAIQFYSCTVISSATGSMEYLTSSGAISYLFKSGMAPKGLEAFFALLSAVYFLIFAIKFFGASVSVQNRKILAVMPVFWATARMLQRFTRTISIIYVSDLLLELFMIAFMMMFFLSFAQLASNVNSRHVVNKIYAYGLIGALLAAVVAVPRLVVLIVEPSRIVSNDPLEICDIGYLIFAVVLCCEMIKMPTEDNITLKEVEKLQKEHEQQEEN